MATDMTSKSEPTNETLALYGADYYNPGTSKVIESPEEDLYFYRAFIGKHSIRLEKGDCLFHLSGDALIAGLDRGPLEIQSDRFAVLVRGYMPDRKTCEIRASTNLPYVNGCSTKQIFPPERPGDPTLQMLTIPPHSSEQAHHTHSTARIVYVLEGRGVSVVGMEGLTAREELYPGKVVILRKFSPHHFETGDAWLTVLPVHVFSSIPQEFSHPMFHGTHIIG